MLVNYALAYTSKEARLDTTVGSDLEPNKYVGKVATIMRLITWKEGDFSSCFDKINKNDFNMLSVKQILCNSHAIDAKKSKIEGKVQLEQLFGFCKTFK